MLGQLAQKANAWAPRQVVSLLPQQRQRSRALTSTLQATSTPGGGSNALATTSSAGIFRNIRARVVADAVTMNAVNIEQHLLTLSRFLTQGGEEQLELLPSALAATESIRATVASAVNTKMPGVKSLQTNVVNSGALAPLTALARRGYPVAFEALQILSYRNTHVCQQLVEKGVGKYQFHMRTHCLRGLHGWHVHCILYVSKPYNTSEIKLHRKGLAGAALFFCCGMLRRLL